MNDTASRLSAALHEQAADIQPGNRLPAILDRANRRPHTYVIALALTAAILLAAAALWQAQQQDQPNPPATVHMQEA